MNVKEFIKNNGYEDKVKACLSQIDESQKKMNECMRKYDSKGYEEASDRRKDAQVTLGMIYINYAESVQCPVNDTRFITEARQM